MLRRRDPGHDSITVKKYGLHTESYFGEQSEVLIYGVLAVLSAIGLKLTRKEMCVGH